MVKRRNEDGHLSKEDYTSKYDKNDDDEKVGGFERASENVLKTRKIAKVGTKRRKSSAAETQSANPFAALSNVTAKNTPFESSIPQQLVPPSVSMNSDQSSQAMKDSKQRSEMVRINAELYNDIVALFKENPCADLSKITSKYEKKKKALDCDNKPLPNTPAFGKIEGRFNTDCKIGFGYVNEPVLSKFPDDNTAIESKLPFSLPKSSPSNGGFAFGKVVDPTFKRTGLPDPIFPPLSGTTSNVWGKVTFGQPTGGFISGSTTMPSIPKMSTQTLQMSDKMMKLSQDMNKQTNGEANNDAGDGGEDDETVPAGEQIAKNEDSTEEVLFESEKSRVTFSLNGNWEVHGVGIVKLIKQKEETEDDVRQIVLFKPETGTIIMNAALYSGLQVKLIEKGDKCFIQLFLYLEGDKITSINGNDDDDVPESTFYNHLFAFKTVDAATKFKDAIEKYNTQ
jgi:hypothetical protein